LNRIIYVAKVIKRDVNTAKKIEREKNSAVKSAAKARRMLKKIIKTKNKTFIANARKSVAKAHAYVVSLKRESIKYTKHMAKKIKVQAKKIGAKVRVQKYCKCKPAAKRIAKKHK